jgi:hypothetical protein
LPPPPTTFESVFLRQNRNFLGEDDTDLFVADAHAMNTIEGSTSGDNKMTKGKRAARTTGTTKATKTNNPNADYNPSKKDHNSNNNSESIDADSIIPCLAYLCATSLVYTHRRKNIARGERKESVWSLANIAVDRDSLRQIATEFACFCHWHSSRNKNYSVYRNFWFIQERRS